MNFVPDPLFNDTFRSCPLVFDLLANFTVIDDEKGRRVFIYTSEGDVVRRLNDSGRQLIECCGECLKCTDAKLATYNLHPDYPEETQCQGVESSFIPRDV